jgi:hypothetical protein
MPVELTTPRRANIVLAVDLDGFHECNEFPPKVLNGATERASLFRCLAHHDAIVQFSDCAEYPDLGAVHIECVHRIISLVFRALSAPLHSATLSFLRANGFP